jgi:hypothetical protein
MALHKPRLQTPEHPVSLTGINKVIKKFNRNTTWVAAGLLGSVIFAALMVALQERHADDLTQEARQTTGDLLSNSSPAAIFAGAGSHEKSTGEITSGRAASVERNPIPETNQAAVQANATSWSPAHGLSARVIIKNPNVRLRSSVHPRYVDVKTRLLALWHQSLRREKARGWTLFSNSNKPQKEKISYTATTSH